jgi:hypothetical protein
VEAKRCVPFSFFSDLKRAMYVALQGSHSMVHADEQFRERSHHEGKTPREYMQALMDLAEVINPFPNSIYVLLTASCEEAVSVLIEKTINIIVQ